MYQHISKGFCRRKVSEIFFKYFRDTVLEQIFKNQVQIKKLENRENRDEAKRKAKSYF